MRSLGLGLLCLIGCAAPVASETTDDALIGGEVDTRHVAVGAFITGTEPRLKSFCTGTLVAPRVVVTAKHCTVDLPADARFAFGNDARHPERVVAIDRFERALPERGGFMNLGSDVAGVVLKEAITDRAPVPVATRALDASDVGTSIVALGYGAQGTASSADTRKAGALTLLAVTGAPLAVRYGNVGRWLDAVSDHLDRELGKFEIEHYELSYRRTLLTGYEAYLSDAAVQTCHGDSGGPLLRATGSGATADHEVVAVVSGGPLPGTISSPGRCSGGNIVAVLGPDARAMLSRLSD